MSNIPQSAAVAKPTMQFSLGSVLGALRYWWKIATPIGLLLAVGAGAAICYTHTPMYTAEAWLHIKPRQEVVLKAVEQDSKSFENTQMEILRSVRILDPLASNPVIASAPEFKERANLVDDIAKRISMRQRGKSDLYVVSFSSPNPQVAEAVVQDAIKSYLSYRGKSESERDSRVINLLEKQREERYREWNGLRDNVRTLSLQLTGIDPFRGNVKESEATKTVTDPYVTMQTDVVKQIVQLELLAAEIKAEEEVSGHESLAVPAEELAAKVEQDPRVLGVRARIERISAKEAEYNRTGVNLDAHPAYRNLMADKANEQQNLETLRKSVSDELIKNAERNFALVRAKRIEGMKREYETAKVRVKILDDRVKETIASAEKTAKAYTGATLDLEFLRAKLSQVSAVHTQLAERILTLTTEQKAPDRVELFRDAVRPTVPNELIPWKKMQMGIAVGFLLPFGLAVAWEHFFRRVTTREQIEDSRQLMVVGEVTALPSRRKRSNPMAREVQLFEESVDGLRTYLSLVESLGDKQVLAVTSAISSEGKTSLASQLAVSFARSTGEPTILIDGDMRAPDIHWVFGSELEPGLVDVLKDDCSIEDAIDTNFSDQLHVLSAGKLKNNPHRLLSSGAFAKLTNELKKTYRHIIIDTPPVLPASESLVIGRVADAVSMCVRRDYSRMDQVCEAHRRLRNAGVNVVGAVINGIPVQQYANKYGTYGYYNAAPLETSLTNTSS